MAVNEDKLDFVRFASKQLGVDFRATETTQLTGGVTRSVWKLDCIKGSYVLRLPSPSLEILGVSTVRACHFAQLASDEGLGPRVVYLDQSNGFMILEYIYGRTLDQLSKPARLDLMPEVMHLLWRMHSISLSTSYVFSPLDLIQSYRMHLSRMGLLNSGLAEVEDTVRPLLVLTGQQPSVYHACHNDAFTKNFLVAEERRLYLIDYDYSGLSDIAIDLATYGSSCECNDEELATLIKSYSEYSGLSQVNLSARVWLYSIILDYVWGMYALLQWKLKGDLPYFEALAKNKFARAICAARSGKTIECLRILST